MCNKCPVNYQLEKCSSKEYGLTCKTCINGKRNYIIQINDERGLYSILTRIIRTGMSENEIENYIRDVVGIDNFVKELWGYDDGWFNIECIQLVDSLPIIYI